MAKILVIDDDRDFLQTVVDILLHGKHEVLPASDGKQGLAIAIENLPDLILCDIMMPEISGFEVLQQIRENPDTQTIPFIFITALDNRKTVREGMAAGADDFLTIPFSSIELLTAVNTRLRRQTQIMKVVSEQQEELDLIRQLDAELSYRMNPSWVIKIMVDWVLQRTKADASIIGFVENHAGMPKLRVQKVIGEWNGTTFEEEDLLELKSPIDDVYYRRQTLLIDDLSKQTDYQAMSDKSTTMVCCPIASDTVVWGILLLESSKKNAFQPSDLNYLRQLTNRAAIALEHSALFEKLIEQQRQEIQMRQLFGRFVSTQVARAIHTGQVHLEGELLEVSALFCDIRSFTTFSDAHTPKEVVGLLNEYLPLVIDAAQVHGGTVNKFGGDSTLIIFGAPVPIVEHAFHAIMTALHIRNNLSEYNFSINEAEGGFRIRIGVGISTGEVIAGAVGPEVRQEYTVIGDTVNLASRIESLNKEFPEHDILISEFTYQALGEYRDTFEYKNLGKVDIRGKNEPVNIWAVLGFADKR